jgi:opacity protein-like surface antigen
MKKWTTLVGAFVAAALATIALPVQAQPRWDLLVTGGWSNGNLSGGRDKLLGTETRSGFTAGAAALLRANDELGFEFAARFVQKGGTGTILETYSVPNFSNVTTEIGQASVELDYVHFDILIAGILDTSMNSYLRGYIGPSLGVLVSANVHGVADGEPFDADMKDKLKSVDWTPTVGASFHYDFGSVSAAVDGRYSMGIFSIDDSGGDYDIKTRTWQISLGIGIPLAE